MNYEETSTSGSISSQLPTIVVLFFTFRLSILFLYTPQGLLNAFTDYHYYFRTAELSNQGYYPFVNMWYEYPPLSTYVVQAGYQLTQAIIPFAEIDNIGYQIFTRLLGIVLLLFETGVLILLHQIAERTWETGPANWLAWVYSGLSLPLFYWNASHSPIVVFFLLLAVFLFLNKNWMTSAIVLGLGIAAKLTPVFFIAPAIKFLWPRRPAQAFYYGAISGASAFAVYLPFFLLGGGPWIAASFLALSRVGSWSTIWSLIDGNLGPGNFGPLSTRLQLEMAAVSHANPSVIPEYFKVVPFAIIYGWFLLRPIREKSPSHLIWFTTLSLMVFHLWSKGWSPQWATLVIPFLLLSFPNWRGLGLILILSAFTYVEWPLYDALRFPILADIAIFGRTGIFFLVIYWTAQRIWKPHPSDSDSVHKPTLA